MKETDKIELLYGASTWLTIFTGLVGGAYKGYNDSRNTPSDQNVETIAIVGPTVLGAISGWYSARSMTSAKTRETTQKISRINQKINLENSIGKDVTPIKLGIGVAITGAAATLAGYVIGYLAGK